MLFSNIQNYWLLTDEMIRWWKDPIVALGTTDPIGSKIGSKDRWGAGSADFEPAALLSSPAPDPDIWCAKHPYGNQKWQDKRRAKCPYRIQNWLLDRQNQLTLSRRRCFPPQHLILSRPPALMYRPCLLPPPACTTPCTTLPRVIFIL